MQLKNLPKRHLILAIGALLAILAVLWLWLGGKEAPAYQTATVTRGDIAETVTAQGKLEPFAYVDVGAQVSGQLAKLHVTVGDIVTPSQLVAELDARVYTSRLAQGQASLNALQAQLEEQKAGAVLAQKNHARNQQMVSASAISREVFETSEAELAAATARTKSLHAQITQAKSGLEENETNLSYTKIYAPLGGTVISTSVKEGQTINASQQAPTIVQIADLSTMTVRAQVAEADVARLAVGTPLYFTTLDMSRRYTSKIRQILPSPQIVNDVVLYNVLADVENAEGSLMSGMSTQITFVLHEAKNVLTIPVGALRNQNDKEQTATVMVLQKGKPVPRPVTLGMANRSVAEVKSGLNEGDIVVTGAASTSPATPRSGGTGRMMGPRI